MQTDSKPKRKNWSSPELSRLSQMILSYQRSNTHFCDIFEYRQRKYVESIKLCYRCFKHLLLCEFDVVDHPTTYMRTNAHCKACTNRSVEMRLIEKRVHKRQKRGTHYSDLFEHYSSDLTDALNSFSAQVTLAEIDETLEQEREKRMAIERQRRANRYRSIGLPDVDNVALRISYQLKKFRRKAKTDFCVNRSNFEEMLGYTPEQLHRHLVESADADLLELPTQAIHIDHIFPLSAYDLFSETEFKAAYALSNLRFLSGLDNSVKSLEDKVAQELFI